MIFLTRKMQPKAEKPLYRCCNLFTKFRKQKTMKQISIIMLLLVLTFPGFAAVVTLSGYLKDKANGEALIGAAVYIPQ